MKILIVGGVAAGTKAAAKIKRGDRFAEVKILTKSQDISYAGCGLPYYVGGAVETRDELIVNTPQKYAALTGAEVVTGAEVTALDAARKTVRVQTRDGAEYDESYDKLVLAVGAEAFLPPVAGVKLPGVFTLRTPDDAAAIRDFVRARECKSAVVCGAGFIGLETAENLVSLGLAVTVIDAAGQILPSAFDPEMAAYAEKKLKAAGLRVRTNTKLVSVTGTAQADGVETDNGRLSADLVIIAIGVRPATAFLEGTGLAMTRGAIHVDETMRTNLPDVYAAGDCALVHSALTGEHQWSAMGSTANLTARVLAKNLTGRTERYKGCLGTGVAKLLPVLSCARTGLTEAQARAAGIDTVSAVSVTDDKAHYYPGSAAFVTKLIAERATGRLLGMQVFGAGEVDKMADIAVLGLACGCRLEDFDTLDFAYAPPFSTAIHPFVTACYVLENKLSGALETVTPAEYAAGLAKDYTVIDAHPKPTIPNAKWLDLTTVAGPVTGLAPDEKLLLVCARGKRGYFLQNRLKAYGYTATRVLEGGATFNEVRVSRSGQKLSPTEIKRVKGLGCLQDKRYDDIFNVRVITRNGKLTSAEQTAVAQAAEKFGSGEVTMTTRLTLEIQGVPYDRLDETFEFLSEAGLETGGTGSKVRPVVSCKGTTCQYGLIDTFALSEKLHKLYYEGYHDMALPHKFKIAVGGCPNNCTKPDLNDLGIVGQRLPVTDTAQCRSCTVCQVEKNCPIHVAKMADGKIVIDPDACNHCGRCVGKCPFGAVKEDAVGYRVYIGGRWGKRIAQGRPLNRIFTSEREIIELVDRAILFYRDEGVSGERFADTIERLGFDYVEDKLLHAAFDKDRIKGKTVEGGATC